jgi:hypothetical protein
MSEKIVMERTYRATLEEVWALWTTKDGIESWWGPEGFTVTVHRPPGRWHAAVHDDGHRSRAGGIHAGSRPAGRHRFDDHLHRRGAAEAAWLRNDGGFHSGVQPYPMTTTVSLDHGPDGVRMTLAFDAMHDEDWTQRSVMGHEGELGRLEKILSSPER